MAPQHLTPEVNGTQQLGKFFSSPSGETSSNQSFPQEIQKDCWQSLGQLYYHQVLLMQKLYGLSHSVKPDYTFPVLFASLFWG